MTTSDVLSAFLAVGLAALLLVALRRLWLARAAHDRTVLWDVTLSVAMGHVFFLMLMPAVLRLILDWKSDVEAFVKPSEIIFVYVIESVSFLVWGTAINTLRRSPLDAGLELDRPANRVERTFVLLVVGVGIVMAAERLVTRAPIDPSRFGDVTSTSVTERYLWPLTPLCLNSGTVIGGYVLARGRRSFGDWTYGCALVGFASFVATFGLGGVRGALIWPLLWMILVDRIYHPRNWMKRAAPLVMAVIAVAFMQRTFVTLRKVGDDATVGDRLEQLRKASDERDDLLASMEYRLGAASRYSVGFVRMWDTGAEAGWNPIYNTILAPVPRVFMPDKPCPTSRDGDPYSTGMYLIVGEIEHRKGFSMTEFLTGSHAYWEFGWIGVVVLSALAGLYGRFAIWFSGRFGQAGPAILFFFFKPWGYNNPKLWVSDIMLEIVQLVPPTIVFWFAARTLAGFAGSLEGALPSSVVAVDGRARTSVTLDPESRPPRAGTAGSS